MRSRRFKKALFVALLGGTLLQATGCGATIASLLVDLVIQYGLSALLGGIVI
jgi:hypothetical protein